MIKRQISILFLILNIILGYSFSPNAFAASGNFGSQPLDDVLSAAANEVKYISDLTKNELTALILAVTWPEIADNNLSFTPSPMALSRWDTDSDLYAFTSKSDSAPYRRAFWHPGIGLWQLDSAGMGANLGIHQRINTKSAAPVVANQIASRWKSSSGIDKDRRAYVWGPWYGCGSGKTKCENIFNQIYNPTNDSLNITRNYNVTSTGGIQ